MPPIWKVSMFDRPRAYSGCFPPQIITLPFEDALTMFVWKIYSSGRLHDTELQAPTTLT